MIKRLAIRLGIFLLPVFLLLGGLEYLQWQLPNDYTHKRAHFEAGLDRWEILILGSSHSYLGINPSLLSAPAFNLAYTAQTLAFDQHLLRSYVERMPRLRQVIVPLSYASLASEATELPGIYNKTYYYHHFWDSKVFAKWYEADYHSLVSLYSVRRAVDQTYRYHRKNIPLIECDSLGWYGPEAQRDLAENGLKSGTFHDTYYDPTLYPYNIQILSDIHRLCQENGVQLVLLSTPMWKSYLNHTRSDRWAEMIRTADSLSQAWQVPYWNHSHDSSYRAEDYFDANHLGPRGARRFTAHIDSLLIQVGKPRLAGE